MDRGSLCSRQPSATKSRPWLKKSSLPRSVGRILVLVLLACFALEVCPATRVGRASLGPLGFRLRYFFSVCVCVRVTQSERVIRIGSDQRLAPRGPRRKAFTAPACRTRFPCDLWRYFVSPHTHFLFFVVFFISSQRSLCHAGDAFAETKGATHSFRDHVSEPTG